MSVLTALDILFGMTAIYLIFALAVTALNEAIAGVLDSRAHWYQEGVLQLFNAQPGRQPGQEALDLKQRFVDSPFIAGMARRSGLLHTEAS